MSDYIGEAAGLCSVRLIVRAEHVVFVKGIVEAHDGLAQVYARSGGDLFLTSCVDRAAELAELARELAREFDGILAETSPV
jgi:hypothetical protein